MKAHVTKVKMLPVVVYYGEGENSPLAAAIEHFGAQGVCVKPQSLSQPLSTFCGMGGKARAAFEGEAPDVKMLVMCNFEEADINRFLNTLREAEIKVPLKAVATKTNLSWSILDLIKELLHEHEQMQEHVKKQAELKAKKEAAK